MKPELAEQLIVNIMEWATEVAKTELLQLQALADYKYDDYRNFEPGMRFIESLAQWLDQFEDAERAEAYQFLKEHLIFVSERESYQLIQLVYPQRIFPVLCQQAARRLAMPEFRRNAIAESTEFGTLQRRSLFLGLSDGARIDDFRRLNAFLSNEQFYASYELTPGRLSSMSDSLKKWMHEVGVEPNPRFYNVFLLDDFSASGSSLVRVDPESGQFKGKLIRFAELLGAQPYQDHFDPLNLNVYVVIYLATHQALRHVAEALEKYGASHPPPWQSCTLLPVYVLSDSIRVSAERDPAFDELLHKYYDKDLENRHTAMGGTDVVYGYANCGLPLVLSHNTPNNSVYLIWAETTKVRPLFRRITRHKVES